ncbi:U7 snRNA-associated Sm-like protein LSm10 [Zerene cesonia]|uniref:U7 snRNA-associated Sm-like protein LSm10 n=1 Tax=Zerene cesonia TaxID=33412 RepID=UPI0018E4ED56|nr:U7 snRNA-associated Sm-like protein LSm10 [Zerene cesonia]XP_038209009.1 U7 snRNA-associated Sm-like protein LSm10 [Zerene cesonia]XP_038209010.1 U7 snRNA-associated Sm-like protein LSm10 [Zerene cesonia]XP_038209011.1 U7 snRNA-associated Sm-like protein LSm10 [Zerene cesonia]XP_038209012.1 U7 snRNA-associated Sm-like protein LSm10 [Zerene cesonia]XP_038209013.1 U7 snRNA-associated Sm-like protein LSm10 [Zerene cesonia]
MFVGYSKERFMYHNTLLCLVRSLEDKKITIDLRNDTYVCGDLVSVDGYMNLSLNKAVYCDPQGNEYFFEHLFVQARNIRYIHIPESVSIISSIKQELHCNKHVPKEKPTAKSRKVQKAQKLHMEIVASLNTDNTVKLSE